MFGIFRGDYKDGVSVLLRWVLTYGRMEVLMTYKCCGFRLFDRLFKRYFFLSSKLKATYLLACF